MLCTSHLYPSSSSSPHTTRCGNISFPCNWQDAKSYTAGELWRGIPESSVEGYGPDVLHLSTVRVQLYWLFVIRICYRRILVEFLKTYEIVNGFKLCFFIFEWSLVWGLLSANHCAKVVGIFYRIIQKFLFSKRNLVFFWGPALYLRLVVLEFKFCVVDYQVCQFLYAC
jgi:hypothetical protein